MDRDELVAELAEVNKAITHILKGGQSYSIDSGGSSRSFTGADLDKLRSYRGELKREIKEIDGEAGMTLGAGW